MVGVPGNGSFVQGAMAKGCTTRRPSWNSTGPSWPPVRVRKAFTRLLAKLQPGWPAFVLREGFMGKVAQASCLHPERKQAECRRYKATF